MKVSELSDQQNKNVQIVGRGFPPPSSILAATVNLNTEYMGVFVSVFVVVVVCFFFFITPSVLARVPCVLCLFAFAYC